MRSDWLEPDARVFSTVLRLATREFHVKFHLKNRYRTHRFAIRAISVFRVKFNVEFPRQVMDFPILYHTSGGILEYEDESFGIKSHETEDNCFVYVVIFLEVEFLPQIQTTY